MKNKNILIIIALVVIIVGGGIYFLNQPKSLQNSTNTASTYNPQTQGKVVFGITDAAGDMDGISSVLVTVNKIEVHSAINGWVTVSNETKQYDLLALKQSGTVSLLVNANLDVGTYDQVKLIINKVIVVKNDVQQEAKLPSGELKIVGNIVVNRDKTSSFVFDFIADKSLHVTGNDKFIFAPVIKITKQDDVKIELKSNNEVDIKEGKGEDSEDMGMNEKGEVKANFELKGNLNIDAEDNISLEETEEEDNEQSDGETDTDLVFNFTAQNNSGLSGTATLSQEDGNVKVNLKLKNNILGLLTTTEPAHVHLGSCANIGNVKYPLSSVVNGKSETTLDVSLAELKAGLPLVINIHKSATEISMYTACTDLNF